MATPVRIVGGGNKIPAGVTTFGQLVVAPLDFSRPATARLLVAGAVVNLIEPKQGHSIVITDIMVSTSKDLGPNGANITVYEADTAITLTSLEDIFETEIVKNTFVPITGLNLGVPQGRFVNIVTNDANVFATVMFYRVKGEILR